MSESTKATQPGRMLFAPTASGIQTVSFTTRPLSSPSAANQAKSAWYQLSNKSNKSNTFSERIESVSRRIMYNSLLRTLKFVSCPVSMIFITATKIQAYWDIEPYFCNINIVIWIILIAEVDQSRKKTILKKTHIIAHR